MKVEYRKRFLKELSKIPASPRNAIEAFVFDELPKLRTLEESGKSERMTGYPDFYKVRFGDYRVGIQVVGDTIILERALHRKENLPLFPLTHGLLKARHAMKELETVVLARNIPEHRLKKGDVGTIVHVHPKGGYEVEFVTLSGETIAVVSLKPSEIRKTEKREIPHVRAVA